MKIVSWNCHYGFTPEKVEAIKQYDADILVIQECREIDMVNATGYDTEHWDWYGDHEEVKNLSGDNKIKRDLGIGVFWKKDIGISIKQKDEWKNSLSKNCDFRYLVPYEVKGKFKTFTLIAVWTKDRIKKNPEDKYEYVEKAHAAIDKYNELNLLEGRVILIGDFNSNTIWDPCYRKGQKHTDFENKLNEMKIQNCSMLLEAKSNDTYYYYYKNQEKKVVNDYCFASIDIDKSPKLYIPDSKEWIPYENWSKRWRGLSDHCPISVKFNF